MDHKAETADVVPAPSAPDSPSSTARRMQEVEAHIGSVIDMVVQSPRHRQCGMSSALVCMPTFLTCPADSATLAVHRRERSTLEPFSRMLLWSVSSGDYIFKPCSASCSCGHDGCGRTYVYA